MIILEYARANEAWKTLKIQKTGQQDVVGLIGKANVIILTEDEGIIEAVKNTNIF